MFEYMIQGIARAGGVEMHNGSTVLPNKTVEPRQAGIVRLFTRRIVTGVGTRLSKWSSRRPEIIFQKKVANIHGKDTIVDGCAAHL